MFTPIRLAALSGLVAALAAAAAHADHPAAPAAAGTAPTAAPAPTTCKIRVCEWVQEPRTVTRTTYRTECKEEAYTSYRCETVTVPETRTFTTCRKACETVMETRTTYTKVRCMEERTVMKTRWVTQQVTEMKTRCVDKGHWEYCEEPVKEGWFARKGKDDCCDHCPKTKCVKKWVSCKVTECYPCTVCKKVKVCEPCVERVCTYKCVPNTCTVPVTKTRLVHETQTRTVNVCKTVQVPVQCKRMV